MLRREARPLRRHLVPVDRVRQQVAGDVLVVELLRVGVRLVDDAAAGDVAALEVLVRDVVEVAEVCGLCSGPCLAKPLT